MFSNGKFICVCTCCFLDLETVQLLHGAKEKQGSQRDLMANELVFVLLVFLS